MTVTPRARFTGFIYLLYFLTAMFAEFLVSERLVFIGDAVNIIANGCYVAVTLRLYGLFKPVNGSVSFLAALLSLAGCAIQTLGVLHVSASHLSPFLFFGPYCILIGYLVLRSTFLPSFLGVLMALAGVGWLVFLALPRGGHLSFFIEGLGILAEVSLMLWLLIIGVNVQRWTEQARVEGPPISFSPVRRLGE